MRLSNLKTGQALDVLVQIARITSNITSDPELIDPIGQAIDPDTLNLNNRGVRAKMIEQWSTFVWRLLEKHKIDFYDILATINGLDRAEIENQPVAATLEQVNEIINDEDLIRFFSSAVQRGKKGQSAPSVKAPVADTYPQEGS